MPFTIPGTGMFSKLLLAHETTYNTAPAAAEYSVELISADIKPHLSVIEDPSMSATQISRRFIGQGGQYVEWSFKARVGYEGLLPLLRMFFPTYTNAAFETVRDHTFKEGITLLSWTLDFLWGNVPANKANRLTGCFCTGWRLAGQAGAGDGAMLTVELSGLARSLTPNTTPMTTAALPTALGVIYHQQLRTTGNFKDGSGDASDTIQLRSFELSATQPHDPERYLFGQVNAEQPVRSGFLDMTVSFEEEWASTSLMAAALANSGNPLKFLFQHPTLISTTGRREFEIQVNSPTSSEFSTAVGGFGVITQRGSFRAAYNTTDSSLAVFRVRSGETAMAF